MEQSTCVRMLPCCKGPVRRSGCGSGRSTCAIRTGGGPASTRPGGAASMPCPDGRSHPYFASAATARDVLFFLPPRAATSHDLPECALAPVFGSRYLVLGSLRRMFHRRANDGPNGTNGATKYLIGNPPLRVPTSYLALFCLFFFSPFFCFCFLVGSSAKGSFPQCCLNGGGTRGRGSCWLPSKPVLRRLVLKYSIPCGIQGGESVAMYDRTKTARENETANVPAPAKFPRPSCHLEHCRMQE